MRTACYYITLARSTIETPGLSLGSLLEMPVLPAVLSVRRQTFVILPDDDATKRRAACFFPTLRTPDPYVSPRRDRLRFSLPLRPPPVRLLRETRVACWWCSRITTISTDQLP